MPATNDISALLIAFFTSWQVRTIIGLIVLDVVLGVASALHQDKFDWKRLADFYRTSVIPYVLGYAVLYVCVTFVIPADFPLAQNGVVTLAWGALVMSLMGSIYSNLRELYPQLPVMPLGGK